MPLVIYSKIEIGVAYTWILDEVKAYLVLAFVDERTRNICSQALRATTEMGKEVGDVLIEMMSIFRAARTLSDLDWIEFQTKFVGPPPIYRTGLGNGYWLEFRSNHIRYIAPDDISRVSRILILDVATRHA